MTVSSTSNKIIYNGNGATTVWSFSFPGVTATDIAVYFTDASGVLTLLSPTLYSVSLNAPLGSNPTGVGGTVTYPLIGSPIAVGTLLTILRTIPLTQTTSLANQGTIYQSVVEAEMDILLMQIQQLNELLGRSLVVSVSDQVPTALPPVAQRASSYLAFDANGNPIAVLGSSSTNPVSSAMTPVVSAASLAAGRTAFGLGNVAVENIGAGLQDDGSGNLRAKFTPVADSTSQSVIAGFHWTERHATGALTYTCPLTSTLFSGFGFFVYALTASVTFAINGADTFSGAATGASLVIPPGTQAYISTDGAGTWFIRNISAIGINSALNLQINATVATNAMTVAIKDRNGNDPSTASPVLIAFRDPTITGGDPVIRAITTALSIVIPNTATLNTTSAQANRLWLVCCDNAGTPVLGVVNCSDATHIYPLNESNIASGTAIAGGSNTGGVIYSNGTVTSKAFRILGFIESTQATAGAWATAPSLIQLFGPGVARPGQVVQNISVVTTSTTATTSSTFQITNLAASITPTSAANPIRLNASGTMQLAGTNQRATTSLFRATTAIGPNQLIGPCSGSAPNNPSAVVNLPMCVCYTDLPNTVSPTVYSVKINSSDNASSVNFPTTSGGFLSVDEIMG